MLRRIANIRASGEHGNGQAARAERTAMRRTVVAERHAADGYHARAGQRCADTVGRLEAIRRCLARADHGHRRNGVEIRPAAAHIQHGRRVVDGPQTVRIGAVTDGDDLDILLRAVADDLLGLGGVLVAQRIHGGLAELTRRGSQCLPVGRRQSLRRTECAKRLVGGVRAQSSFQRKPNIAES